MYGVPEGDNAEEEAEDRKDYANDLAGQCTCPAECELDEEDHAYIAKYAVKEEK